MSYTVGQSTCCLLSTCISQRCNHQFWPTFTLTPKKPSVFCQNLTSSVLYFICLITFLQQGAPSFFFQLKYFLGSSGRYLVGETRRNPSTSRESNSRSTEWGWASYVVRPPNHAAVQQCEVPGGTTRSISIDTHIKIFKTLLRKWAFYSLYKRTYGLHS